MKARNKQGWSRREFALAALPLGAAAEVRLPVRTITRGPRFHWFGYYDKLQFDSTGRFVLGMEVGFEHRSPRPGDGIKLGMIDLAEGDRWIELGETAAWCWQQGCMLQWLPGSKTEVIFNVREEGRYASRILDVKTRKQRALPGPIYAVSPDGKWAVTPDFRRLADTRPGYGYNGIADPNREHPAPEDSGIWRMNLRTGEQKLIITFAQVARIANPNFDFSGVKHWFNHLLFSPRGNRFIFLHRWTGGAAGKRRITRMFTANLEGKELHVVDDFGFMSHFVWRDAGHVLGWASRPPRGGRFYLYEDQGSRVDVVGEGVMTADGHCTYLPGNRWILCDTYPDAERYQQPYLFDTRTGGRHPLGQFLSPKEYTGEWRCDTHPRSSPDGRSVCIDSPHDGGRQLHLIDVSPLVGG
ncbi:MAG: hypothetical protein FJW30_20930 [Acidobacteria bacterium]|nr:hypothetical protein [Acidobacteriota bacterium]